MQTIHAPKRLSPVSGDVTRAARVGSSWLAERERVRERKIRAISPIYPSLILLDIIIFPEDLFISVILSFFRPSFCSSLFSVLETSYRRDSTVLRCFYCLYFCSLNIVYSSLRTHRAIDRPTNRLTATPGGWIRVGQHGAILDINPPSSFLFCFLFFLLSHIFLHGTGDYQVDTLSAHASPVRAPFDGAPVN